MRILLTGFEPFNNGKLNPSEEIVRTIASQFANGEAIAGVELHTAVLPVVFGESSSTLRQLIALHKPEAVVCLGQAEGRKELSFERVAINLDDARIPDNSGRKVTDQPIIDGGPAAHFTTLPVRQLVEVARAEGVAAGLSLSAGSFVCNHIFYNLQHELAGQAIASGFIHVPLIPEQSADFPGLAVIGLADQVRAIRAVLATLAQGVSLAS